MSTSIDIVATRDEIVREIRELPNRSTAALRTVRREYSRRLRDAPPDQIVALALALNQMPDVHRFIGDELIAFNSPALRSLDEITLLRLAHPLERWDQVDCFSLYLAGRAWRLARISDETVADWTRSPNRWWRRVALVSTVALNLRAQGGAGDAPRTLAICQLLVHDRDDMVVKAMSWAIRALSIPHRAEVERFLVEQRSQLAPRVVREVEHKLRTGLKSPHRDQRPLE
jgi:hypothetical protein